jgi:meiotic recombination protein REC8, fungi type
MRRVIAVLSNTVNVNLEVDKRRAGQLVVEDDPNFLPELLMPRLNDDFFNLEILGSSSQIGSSLMSSESILSSKSSTHTSRKSDQASINLPESTMNGNFNFKDFFAGDRGPESMVEARGSALINSASDLYQPAFEGEEAFYAADFEFDAEGNILEIQSETPDVAADLFQGQRLDNDSVVRRVRREHEEGLAQFEVG